MPPPPFLWYLPIGTPPPPHLRPGLPAVRLEPGQGPDGAGGGLMVGGLYDQALRGQFQRTAAGWWVRASEIDQDALDGCLRLRGEPYRLATTAPVAGPAIAVRVARLLDAQLTVQPHLVTTIGALDPATGQAVVHEVVRHEALLIDLANYWRGVRFAASVDDNNLAVLRLACRVLGLSYHLDECDWFAARIMTWQVADLVLSAACDLTVDPLTLRPAGAS